MSYNATQTTFVLSILANLAQKASGTTEELETALYQDIQTQLTSSAFQTQIGSWEVAWGPVVKEVLLSSEAQNVMYVAKNEKESKLVVAIAGTNPTSSFDWIIEDGYVGHQALWGYGNAPRGTKISQGTQIGLSYLQGMTPAAGFPGTGLKIQDFLATQTSSAVEVVVTGHSLGGALAPVLALWLSDTREQWDPRSNATLTCMPTAGPTPGNELFATYYASQLGAATTRIYNQIDVIPHAWATSDLKEIPDLYGSQFESEQISVYVDMAIFFSELGDYTQLLVGEATVLPGKVDMSLYDSSQSATKNFLAQLGYQHVQAYFDMLGVDGLLENVPLVSVEDSGELDQAVARLEARVERQQKITEALAA